MVSETKVRRGGKKNRKHGRNKRAPSNARYTAEKRWVANRTRRIEGHLRRHPNDKTAAKALKR